jgi:hypothetical protein
MKGLEQEPEKRKGGCFCTGEGTDGKVEIVE